ncbi:hypothetical protein XELAEV_18038298mg [Xenopus laevis]|uniref:Uncharacterized protein n=1 Tax=Xenopus laevis TaxID=8355 RepID=A0A974C5P9_XENLA|nr:hypothetical protein XELAEV_18038298mg [Xenopus laevis]
MGALLFHLKQNPMNALVPFKLFMYKTRRNLGYGRLIMGSSITVPSIEPPLIIPYHTDLDCCICVYICSSSPVLCK